MPTQIHNDQIPVLARGCRMSRASAPGGEAQLLLPEGLLKLSPSGARIVELCDGKRTVAGIISTLQSEHDSAAKDRIHADVLDYLDKLLTKKALELK